MSVTGVTVDEDAGSATFTVRLSKRWTSIVYVDVDTFNGTATAGSDYTAVDRRVSVSRGATTRSVSVSIIDDTTVESNETFTLRLSNPSNATLSASPSATSTIRDDDTPPPPVVSLTSTVLSVAETNSSGVQIAAVLNKAATRASSVRVSATGAARGGSCYAGVEFYLSSSSFSFSVGADRASITLYPCADTDYNNETINVNLSSVGIAGLTLGSPTTTVVTILDPAPPVVSITGPGTVDEDAGSATFTVTLSKTWTAAVLVDVDTSNGTATAGSDYSTVNRTVTINAGSTSLSVLVTIIDDTTVETDETFTVTLSNPANAALSGSPDVQVTIRDDDVPPTTTTMPPTTTVPGPGF